MRIIAFILCLVPFGLGTWQVQRLMWKNDLIARLDQASQVDPIPLPDSPREFSKVFVTGAFLDIPPLKLNVPSKDNPFNARPLRAFRRDTGQVILVEGEGAPLTIRLPQKPNLFTPANNPAKNQWYHIDLHAMGKALNVPLETRYYVMAVPFTPKLTNRHLEYAFTWYAFGVIGLVFLFLGRKKIRV